MITKFLTSTIYEGKCELEKIRQIGCPTRLGSPRKVPPQNLCSGRRKISCIKNSEK
jgi:hypothetical protein